MYDVFDSEYYERHGLALLVNSTVISLVFAMVGLLLFIPLIIHRFELAFAESGILHDQQQIASKENAIIAAFILLDMNGDLDIDSNEFQSLVSSSILVDKDKLFDAFDNDGSDGIDINEFVAHLLKQTFRTKIMSSSVPRQNKMRAWLECNIVRHRLYKTWVLIVLVLTALMICLVKGVSTSFSESSLNSALYVLFAANLLEIMFVVFVYGIQRFFDLLKYPNPNYVAAAISKYQANSNSISPGGELDHTEVVRLTSAERTWVLNHLGDVRPLSVLEKSTQTLMNRMQFVVIWSSLALFVLSRLYFATTQDELHFDDADEYRLDQQMNERYSVYFIQFGILFRMFFLIPSNQKLIYVIFSVFPQFISLFAFLGLFMYAYARVGCTLFGDQRTTVVQDNVYDAASTIKTNFDSLPYSMLALLQLMVGEGWHEIMYYNVIATHPLTAFYFVFFIFAVTIIISNVFVGLFLADIDELTVEQQNDEILQNSHKTQSFEKYANYKLNLLQYQIKMDDIRREKMQKQADQIELLLYHHKLKLVQTQ